MAHHQGSDHRTGWDQFPPEAARGPVAARRHAREAEAARRARVWYHARWIVINLVLIAASAWLYAHVLIPRFITKELTSQAAVLVHADYEGSAPSARSAGHPMQVTVNTNHRRHRITAALESQSTPKPAYADSAMIKELGAQCVAGRVFRKTVTNGVTEITEVADLRC